MKPTWCHKHNTRVALHHKPQRGPWRQPRLPKRQQQLLRSSSTNTKSCQSPEFSVSPNLKVKSLSRVRLFATPWTVAHQARPSMEFSRQEYWSGLLFPFPGDFPDPGIKPGSPAFQADSLPSEPLWSFVNNHVTDKVSSVLTHTHSNVHNRGSGCGYMRTL